MKQIGNRGLPRRNRDGQGRLVWTAARAAPDVVSREELPAGRQAALRPRAPSLSAAPPSSSTREPPRAPRGLWDALPRAHAHRDTDSASPERPTGVGEAQPLRSTWRDTSRELGLLARRGRGAGRAAYLCGPAAARRLSAAADLPGRRHSGTRPAPETSGTFRTLHL